MTNNWFVFNNTGKFLFKTSDFSRTKNIPESYNVTYIIKNPPGYDPFEDQKIFYNTETNLVEFSELTVATVTVNLEEEQNIIDTSELLIEIEGNKQKIDTLTSTITTLTSTITTLTTRLDELETKLTNTTAIAENDQPIILLSSKINEMETQLINTSTTFNNIFPV